MKTRIAENVENLRALQVVKARLASEERRERLEKIAKLFEADLRDPETFQICLQMADSPNIV